MAKGALMEHFARLRSQRSWTLLAVAAALAIAALAARRLLKHGSDFRIYLHAARELFDSSVDLYRDQTLFGGPYPYPHWFVLPIRAMDALFGETATILAWSLLLGCATVLLLRACWNLSRHLGPLHWSAALVFLLLFHRFITHNLTKGQASLLVATLVACGLDQLLRRRDRCAGFLLGVAAASKLTPIAWIAFLAWHRRWRAAFAMLATVLVLVFVVPLPFMSFELHAQRLRDFASAMILPAMGLAPPSSASIWTDISASVSGTFGFLLTAHPPKANETHPNIADLAPATIRFLEVAWSLTLLCIGAIGAWRAQRLREPQRLVLQAAIAMLLLVLLQPLTRVYHLANILVAGAVFVTLRPASGGPQRRHAARLSWWIVAGLFFVVGPLRQKKILGEDLYLLFQTGLMHVALAALLCSLALFLRPRD